MSVTTLFKDLTAAQTLPIPVEGGVPGSNLPTGSQMADFHSAGAGTAVGSQSSRTFQINVIGASPGVTVSATVQPLGSNDGIHWMGDGAAISVASGASPGMGSATVTSAFAYATAYLQAVSGNGAKVTCLMNG